MIDHILSAVLTFALLAGNVAIGTELLTARQPVGATAEVTLPMVTVTGRRAAPVLLAAETCTAATPTVQ